MTGEKPKVFKSAKFAWIDVGRVISGMPAMTIAAGVIGLIYAGFDISMSNWHNATISSFRGLLISAVVGVVWTFFLTPFYLAIHRYIILGEVKSMYSIEFGEPRFQRFFLYSLVLYALALAPSLVLVMSGTNGVGITIALGLTLVMVFVATRVIVLFPAIAVDSLGASFGNAFGDTQGNFWRIFGIVLVTIAPILIVSVIVIVSVGEQSAVAKIFSAIASMLNMAITIALASRLYQRLADQVGGPGRGSAQLAVS
jgi:hypothetical protein